MPSTKKLDVGDSKSFTVYPLPSNKRIACQNVVIGKNGRAWAIDSKGKLLASQFGDLRVSRGYVGRKTVPIQNLLAQDIVALGELGLIDAAIVEQNKMSAIRAKAFEREIGSIEYDVKSLAEVGISVPKGWKKLAEAHATTKADEYMKRNYA